MNVIVRCRPGFGQCRHIQILLRMGTPIQANRTLDVVMQHVLYDALNRGKASAACHHDDGLAGVFSQKETTEWGFYAQYGFFRHFIKNVFGKLPTGD